MQARFNLENKMQIRNLFKKKEFAHLTVGTIIVKVTKEQQKWNQAQKKHKTQEKPFMALESKLRKRDETKELKKVGRCRNG
jgi:LmbE family N-acetylglucosaminyl deacetylase